MLGTLGDILLIKISPREVFKLESEKPMPVIG